ncbi:uncharacterized protein LOC111058790 isoform X2 [Nilaparvata lugens]|uniref:uncharacterized protein LOC111058790 isoform X1 n=1 Tax=Nilaparvata lugens TaxID=108931 RepID=UPI00193E4789|nr:uncharacterized protein LOC111058790 isoform X1 [Nilaparvata lugens]XP_039276714.1 uncharacterized protein LOC111058790 isoform X2 [Nilaparvata lugens]
MSTTSKLPIETPKNISKLYIEKIKREEDEDQWISGEELNTDGSSDEEEKGREGSRGKRQGHRGGARPKVPPLAAPKEGAASESADEPPLNISWKPKRGSIRLPHVISDTEINPKDTTSQVPKE